VTHYVYGLCNRATGRPVQIWHGTSPAVDVLRGDAADLPDPAVVILDVRRTDGAARREVERRARISPHPIVVLEALPARRPAGHPPAVVVRRGDL
jgi:hypothetical protein